MDAEFAKRWVADLRDPANTQCKAKLHDGVGYCCLGRAVVLAGATLVPLQELNWRGDPELGTEEEYLKTDPETYVVDGTQTPEPAWKMDGTEHMTGGEYQGLTKAIACNLDMDGTDGAPRHGGRVLIGGVSYASLADANDRGCTFSQIADWIEANHERL